MLEIYLYDENNEYAGESSTMLDPEETKVQGRDVWLMPPNSTILKPELKDGYFPVWNGNSWDYVEDNRGLRGWVNHDFIEIKELGPLPDGFSLTEPEFTIAEKNQLRRQEILAELDRIDRASSRSLRAILTAQVSGQEPDAADVSMLAGHEALAKTLRAELAELN